MDIKLITLASNETLSGNLSFPKIVEMLTEAGVEYYHVDYVGVSKSFYSAEGERFDTVITYDKLPNIAPELDIDALKAAITDSQQNNQKYYDFTVRAMKAGVQGYFTFLRGKRVTYLGRNGDQHTEWFPGAK